MNQRKNILKNFKTNIKRFIASNNFNEVGRYKWRTRDMKRVEIKQLFAENKDPFNIYETPHLAFLPSHFRSRHTCSPMCTWGFSNQYFVCIYHFSIDATRSPILDLIFPQYWLKHASHETQYIIYCYIYLHPTMDVASWLCDSSSFTSLPRSLFGYRKQGNVLIAICFSPFPIPIILSSPHLLSSTATVGVRSHPEIEETLSLVPRLNFRAELSSLMQ
jgi:hypothetical protein